MAAHLLDAGRDATVQPWAVTQGRSEQSCTSGSSSLSTVLTRA